MASIKSAPFLILLIIGVAPFLLFGCGQSESTDTNPEGESAIQEQSKPAADLFKERFVLTDLAGKQRSWSEFTGKPLIINFWATWCGPCRREMPIMVKLYEEYKPRGLEIVGISIDHNKRAVAPFIEQLKIPWVIVYGDRQVPYEFKLGRGIPMTIFFDADGKETGRVTGAQPEVVFRRELAKLFPTEGS